MTHVTWRLVPGSNALRFDGLVPSPEACPTEFWEPLNPECILDLFLFQRIFLIQSKVSQSFWAHWGGCGVLAGPRNQRFYNPLCGHALAPPKLRGAEARRAQVRL